MWLCEIKAWCGCLQSVRERVVQVALVEAGIGEERGCDLVQDRQHVGWRARRDTLVAQLECESLPASCGPVHGRPGVAFLIIPTSTYLWYG